jgi:hypothetical protein
MTSAPAADEFLLAGRMELAFEFPVHFVHSELERWHDLTLTDNGQIAGSDYLSRTTCGRDNWVVQTCLMLRVRGHKVTLGPSPRRGCINISHYDDIYPRHRWSAGHFIVGIRADRDPVFISQMEVHQNRSLLRDGSQVFIPFWPQPGLIRRDPSRGDRVENVMFAGLPKNMAASFRGPEFEQAIQKLGARLMIRQRGAWHDYSDADLVLAVRDGTRYFLAIKPPSKLINAWHTGCPALLGAEPAYQELRQSEIDYIEVRKPQDALDAIRRLKADPALYRRMVNNGLERCTHFTREAVAREWEKTIAGPITERYRTWSKNGDGETTIRRIAHSFGAARRRMWGVQYNSGFDMEGRRRRSAKLGTLRRLIVAPIEFMG